jgi:hypothetical protein
VVAVSLKNMGRGMGARLSSGRTGRGPGRGAQRTTDTDGDGVIAESEVPEALRPLFDVLDVDGSGSLDEGEARLLHRLMRELPREKNRNRETKPGGGRDQG